MSKLRSLFLFALAGVWASTSALVAQVATPTVRITGQINDNQLVTLKGMVHPLANAANDRGAVPASLPLDHLQLLLKRSATQDAALQQLIEEQHTPGSANYHKWLIPTQFAQEFGPSDQDLATVETWLTGHGFNVEKVNPGRQSIQISGSVAQMRTAFHTDIHQYQVGNALYYANANNPEIPAALAPVVSGFATLNNFPLRSYARSPGRASYNPSTGTAAPQWTIGSGSAANANYYVLSPADYAVQYDLNPLYQQGIDGRGQTIAIINESNINVGLVNQFRTLFGLPYNPPQVILAGNDPGIDGSNNPSGPNGASVEAYLDVEWAGAVAPKATVDLVIAGDTALANGLVLAMQYAVYNDIAPVISVSFGNCEANMGSFNQTVNALWEQAAAQGQTVIVSTGDSGSAGCDNENTQDYASNGQAVSGFASTPYDVAVGGTDFFYSQFGAGSSAINSQLATYWNTTTSNSAVSASLLAPIPEQPWNESQFGDNIVSYYAQTQNQATSIAGGSGGASNAALCANNSYNSSGVCTSTTSGYAKPAWQKGTGVPTDGVRDIPDVSLFASSGINNSFYPICATDGDCQAGNPIPITAVGGTSASAPSFAGMMALVNQKYGPQGQADAILYPLAAQFPTTFHDVTNGSNSVPCAYSSSSSSVTPKNCIAPPSNNTIVLGGVTEGQIGSGTTPEYNATAGYDLASGLGTVDATQLVTNWGNVKLASTTTTLVPSQTTFAHGTSVTFTGTVTANGSTPTGDVALMTDNTDPGQQGIANFTLNNGAFTSATNYSSGINFLPGGTYNIWAHYSGDSNNGPGNSAKTQITVTPENSAIDFNLFQGTANYTCGGSTPGTTVDYGTQLLLSALVAPSSQAANLQSCVINNTNCANLSFSTPTGSVTFSDTTSGSGLPVTMPLNAEGDAEFNAPFSVGKHSVTASYAGDQSYNKSSASCSIGFTVVQDQPAMFVNASNYAGTSQTSGAFQFVGGANQPTVVSILLENNAQYTYNSNSTSGAIAPVPVAPPTGTITLQGLPSGVPSTATLSAGVDPTDGAQAGIATVTIPAGTPANTYTVSITYNGDTNYQKVSGSGTLQIVPANGTVNTSTTATMTGSISPNTTLNITGTVTAQSGSAAPTGYIQVFSSGNYVPTQSPNAYNLTVPSSGTASTFSFKLKSSDLAQGANYVTLQYIPASNSSFAPSAYTLNSGNPIANSQSDFTVVPLMLNVPINISGGAASGTSTISLSSVNGFSGTVNLTCTADVGVTCSISPTAGLSAGGSTTATLTINAPAKTANQTYNVRIVATDAATGAYVHTAAVHALVSGSPAGSSSFALTNSGDVSLGTTGTATGTVTVMPVGASGFTGAVALSCAITPSGAGSPTCAVTSPVTLSGTTAQTATVTLTTAGATAGNYTATITGTSGSISMTTSLTVAVGTPSFTLPANNSVSITISTPGATTGNTASIAVTPVNEFNGTVSLSCAVTTSLTNPNEPPTCSITPSVTISSTSPQNATLTVTTTAATAMNTKPEFFWPSTGGAVLALVFLFWGPERRRRWLTMLGVLLLMVAAAGMGACGGGGGGGSSSGGGGSSSNPGTTTGAYTVTVTATSGSGSSAITKTTAVAVTVQ